jgi:hypothetical protein
MKSFIRIVAIGAAIATSNSLLQAQTVTLPRDSAHASVLQSIGLVDVTIDYSSPRVTRGGTTDRRGKIWGGLVPYGLQPTLGYGTCTQCPWRGGANENTTFKVSEDVKVEGQPLKAGTYGVHFIPDPNEWTVIFSNNSTSWGSFFYDPAEDALRVKVKPSANPYHEFLTYEFTDREADKATVALEWEELRVPFTITVSNEQDLYLARLRRDVRGGGSGDWRNWNAAAQYALQNKTVLPEALVWAQTAVDGTFIGTKNLQTLTTLADAQEANGQNSQAAKTREEALNDPAATAQDLHQYGRQLQLAGKKEEAAKVFELNAKRHPNAWPVNVGLMRASSIRGRNADALKYAKLALAQAPDPGNRKNLENMIKTLESGKSID